VKEGKIMNEMNERTKEGKKIERENTTKYPARVLAVLGLTEAVRNLQQQDNTQTPGAADSFLTRIALAPRGSSSSSSFANAFCEKFERADSPCLP
jgi:hypothetical protein